MHPQQRAAASRSSRRCPSRPYWRSRPTRLHGRRARRVHRRRQILIILFNSFLDGSNMTYLGYAQTTATQRHVRAVLAEAEEHLNRARTLYEFETRKLATIERCTARARSAQRSWHGALTSQTASPWHARSAGAGPSASAAHTGSINGPARLFHRLEPSERRELPTERVLLPLSERTPQWLWDLESSAMGSVGGHAGARADAARQRFETLLQNATPRAASSHRHLPYRRSLWADGSAARASPSRVGRTRR